ncbi:MAG: MerR family transcriptional regulator [Deltaproteobacteria bacterium]|nr:MerR family transcriptional regulator [Deltaproteobacteria bacterium]MBW2084870.1 MerR family transcriptional regulator [Deltaproteobacteria bacterium]
MTMSPEVPDKIYFRIGEAAELIGVEPFVLRYWESEFPQIKPVRAASKQRLYRRQDLETFLAVKRLLYEDKFTIAGAKKRIAAKAGEQASLSPEERKEFLLYLKNTLAEIKNILQDE